MENQLNRKAYFKRNGLQKIHYNFLGLTGDNEVIYLNTLIIV